MPRVPKDLTISFSDDTSPPVDFPKTPGEAFSRASKSFENLVALANDEERWRGVSKKAKKAVWRDTGEPPKDLATLRACLEHASTGGLRAGMLAGTMRSGFNLFLLLFRIARAPRKFKTAAVLQAIFSPDSFRFAAMLSTFTFVYKLMLNSLPLMPIPDSLAFLRSPRQQRNRDRAMEEGGAGIESIASSGAETPLMMKSRTSKAKQEPEKGKLSLSSKVVYSRLDGARWHAIVAGALAGLSVMWETRGRRMTLAQQIFVRGLQGSWNAWAPRMGIKVPYGAVWVFTFCCGQIMYAFLLRPETIPRSYWNWILKAAKVHGETMRVNLDLFRTGKFDPVEFKHLMEKPENTPKNLTYLKDMLVNARAGDFQGRRHLSCEGIHPWVDDCSYTQIDRFINVWTWMFPVYGALHLIPTILFKRGTFMREPLQMLLRSLKNTMRSSTFLATFVVLYQSFMCARLQFFHSDFARAFIPKGLRDVLISRQISWINGALTGLALFIEAPHRRAELAMYVLPRGLESAWSTMRGRGYVPFIPFGDGILCAVGMSMVMSTYQHDPQHLSGLVRRILYQFIGPN